MSQSQPWSPTQQQQQQQQLSPPPRLLRTRSETLTSQHRITLLEEKLNWTYHFKDDLLALEALQNTALPQELNGRMREIPLNRNLAILGDVLLDLHLCLEWMETSDTREAYQKRKSQVAGNKNLDSVGREKGLEDCVIRMPNTTQAVGKDGMASTVEAIIGAVYKDAESQRAGSGLATAIRMATEFGLHYCE